jgi:hypothetical protein
MEDLGNLRFKICPHCGKPIRPKIGEKIWREPDVILDPMAGTSSTGIIASLLGRHSVCVELEQKFCEWSRRNVYIDIALVPLFDIVKKSENSSICLHEICSCTQLTDKVFLSIFSVFFSRFQPSSQ